MARVAALIPAAGAGLRLGRGPKAFVEVAGESLLSRAVRAFSGRVDETVVAVPAPSWEATSAHLGGLARVILGGETRQKSVHNLLRATEAEIVLVHDAARPFLEPGIITAVAEAATRHGAASAAVPVADTLIEAETGAVVERERLRAVQTPQGFRHALLLTAHDRALETGVSATDDAGLVRLLGARVALVAGSPWLMKITTPEDLELGTALAGVWDAR